MSPPAIRRVPGRPGPDWTGLARGVGAAVRSIGDPGRRDGRRSPPAAFPLHDLPPGRQFRVVRQARAA